MFIVHQGRHSAVFVVTLGELAGERLIFSAWVADGLIGEGILGIWVWTGFATGMKTADLLVGDGGGEGYGIQTAFGAMAGKRGVMAGIPGAWLVATRFVALPWQYEAKCDKSFSLSWSLPSLVMIFLLTSFAHWLKPALYSASDLGSARKWKVMIDSQLACKRNL